MLWQDNDTWKTTFTALVDIWARHYGTFCHLAKIVKWITNMLKNIYMFHCSAYFFLIKVPAHHSAPASAALAEGSRADCIQICSPCVQVSSRVSTCIPY